MTSAVELDGSPFLDQDFLESNGWIYWQDVGKYLDYLNGTPAMPAEWVSAERAKLAAAITERLDFWVPISGPH